MPTLRVFQVAKLLKVEGEEILDALSDMGISVSSNLAPLDEAIVAELKELFKPKPQAAVKAAAEKKVAAAPGTKRPLAAKKPAAEAAAKTERRAATGRRVQEPASPAHYAAHAPSALPTAAPSALATMPFAPQTSGGPSGGAHASQRPVGSATSA